MKPWDAKEIFFIRLGEGNKWWEECEKKKIIRLGYNSGSENIYEWAINRQWKEVNKHWKQTPKSDGTSRTNSECTSRTNQTKLFFNDDGKTLWITFLNNYLYYAFTDGEKPIRTPSNNSSYRRLTAEGWKNVDKENKPLRMEDLSGNLTKTAIYRKTICKLKKKAEDYLRRRLKSEESPDLKKTRDSYNDLIKSIKPLIQSLTWKDFELLVELIFSNSGWQKTTKTGGNQKTTDLDLKNPITGDQIWVQVKSSSNPAVFKEYKEKHETEKSSFKTMYYVYHSGKIGNNPNEDDEEKFKVWDLEKVAEYVVSNGLTNWLMDKSK